MSKINPSIALISSFIYSLIVSFSIFEIYFILPIVFILYLERKNILNILKKLLFLNLFIFVLFLVLLIDSSFEDALNVYIRANAIILLNLSLFFHSRGYDVVRALNILKFPNSVVSSTYFTLKMIEFLTSDFKNIKNSLRARGFKANTTMFAYQTFGNVIGMLFVKAIRKSESLKQTFIVRGFHSKIYLNDEFDIKKYDYFLVILIAVIFLAKVIL